MPEELTKAARELSEDIQNLGPTLERHRQTVLKADRRSKAGVIAGIIGITVAIFALFIAADVHDLQRSVAADSASARVASCVQFNVQREQTRAAMKLALASLAPPAANQTDQQRTALETYSKAVDLGLPYRDCSPAGIEAYFQSPPKDPAK